MNKFLIVLKDGNISISKYINAEFEVIKHEGEVKQKYDFNSFWLWFKDKIEYTDEELSFVVVTDNKEFCIPTSCGICLSQTNSFDDDSFIDEKIISISKGMFVFSFPQRKERAVKASIEEKEIPKVQIEELLGENDIANYFRKQTQEFKNE